MGCGSSVAAKESCRENLKDSIASRDLKGLRLAIDKGVELGLEPEELEEARAEEAKLSALRDTACTHLKQAVEARSLTVLNAALDEAQASGLNVTDMAEARSTVTELELHAQAAERLGRATEGFTIDLDAAVAFAKQVGFAGDGLKKAEVKLAEIEELKTEALRELKQAVENLDRLDRATELEEAIKKGRDVGLLEQDVQVAENAMQKFRQISAAREKLTSALGCGILGLADDAVAEALALGLCSDDPLIAALKREEDSIIEAAAKHKGGVVLWVDSQRAFSSTLQPCVDSVSKERGVVRCVSDKRAIKALQHLSGGQFTGQAVCLVAPKGPGMVLAEHLRHDSSVSPLLCSIPVVLFTLDESLVDQANDLGCTIVRQKEKLAPRILSLPSLAAMRSEARAGLFQGSTTNVRFGHYKDHGKDVVFTDNEKVLMNSIQRKRLSWYPEVEEYDEHISRLESYMQALQPLHRCKPGVFLAMLREGGLMSREELEKLLGSKHGTIMRTARHVRLQDLCRQSIYAGQQRRIFKYAEAVCELDLAKNDADRRKAEEKKDDFTPVGFSPDQFRHMDRVIHEVVSDIKAQQSLSIGGIGYAKDALLGTTRHVFSTLGPNSGFHYGSVVILLSRDLQYQPGFWCTPLAATGFVGPNFWVFRHRPWGNAALLDMALHATAEDAENVLEAAETPEKDDEGVDSCLASALNMAAMENWPRIMSREVDAMCHYLTFEHRSPSSFDEPFDERKCKEFQGKLVGEKDGTKYIKDDAWESVVEFYEMKDSHTLYECHLPGFVPLGAIEKVIISNKLYDEHTEIKDKVDNYVFPDGRRLSDMMVLTRTPQQCMGFQHNYFERKRRNIAAGNPRKPRPVSAYVAGRQGRPAYVARDFPRWSIFQDETDAEDLDSDSISISFACRATHDVRVIFSQHAEAQHPDCRLKDASHCKSSYTFVLGAKSNSECSITKGLQGTRHTVHLECDATARLTACGSGESSKQVWERYWFHARCTPKCTTVRCGKGPVLENVIMELVDSNSPITDLKYVGLSCWNQATIYCDLHPRR